MKFPIISSILFFSLALAAKDARLVFPEPALDQSKAAFIEHTGEGPFANYLAMNIAYAPIEKFRADLEARLGAKLKNRGEAHITVITPPEYNEVLKPYVTIQEINRLAKDMRIQNSSFKPVCLGRGQTKIEGKTEQTYYIVVESHDLLKIRREVFKKYVDAGGEPSLFDPDAFYPHITLGFTQRDLHESDGIKKGKNSCLFGLKFP